MAQLVAQLRGSYPQATLLFDPQFYAATIPQARDRHLPSYPYYRPLLSRSEFGLSAIRALVPPVLNYQANLDLSRIIAPTIALDDMSDRWSQIAIYLCQESVDCHAALQAAPPLLLSVVVSENALATGRGLDDFLDEITALNCHGFYIIVERSQSYAQRFDDRRLAALMYMVHVLGHVNRFEVIVGYTDLAGMLLRAAGAHAWACGWSQSLRQFSRTRFRPVTGGRRARERYTSLPLLNSVLLSEVDACQQAQVLNRVLSGSPYDQQIEQADTPLGANWQKEVSALHHWWVLAALEATASRGNVNQRLAACSAAISRARGVYAMLGQAGIRLAPPSDSGHLDDWRNAIDAFTKSVG
jgi:hypothetical protein